MTIETTKDLLDILTTIKFCDVDEVEKIKAIDLAIKITKDWNNYLDYVGKRNAIEDAIDFFYEDGNIDYQRLTELVKADKENRLIVFQLEFSVAKIYYPKDEDGLYAMKAIGIVSEEEYLKHLNEENKNQKQI